MYGSGLQRKLPTPTIRVLVGEAVSAIQVRTVLQLTVTALALTTATTTSVSVFHFSRKSWTLETRNLKQEEKIKMITESYKKAHASHSEWNTLCGKFYMSPMKNEWADI